MAKRTIADVFDQVRYMLQDRVVPYRYPDADLIDHFNSSLYELKRVRPDAYIGAYGVDLSLYTTADMAVEVPFSSIFFQPVVLFVTGYAELRDDEFAVDGRAVGLIGAFSAMLGPPSSGRVQR